MKRKQSETMCHQSNICAGSAGRCIDVAIVGHCQCNCYFCFAENSPKPVFAHVPTMLKVVNGLADYDSVLILGGEPLLHPKIGRFIRGIKNKKIYLTTNGVLLNAGMAEKLKGLTAINISIHHFYQLANSIIFRRHIDFYVIARAIRVLKKMGIKVRFNCLFLEDGIDTPKKVKAYIAFAKEMGADEIKFAEVQKCPELFVDAHNFFPSLVDDPFRYGCRATYKRQGLKVTVQQTCGLVNPVKEQICNPVGRNGKTMVVQPNCKVANGWEADSQRASAPECHVSGCHRHSGNA